MSATYNSRIKTLSNKSSLLKKERKQATGSVPILNDVYGSCCMVHVAYIGQKIHS